MVAPVMGVAQRALLYEKGKPLKAAIIEALRTLGFIAAPIKNYNH